MNVRFSQNASRQVFTIICHYAELDRDLGRCLIDQIDELRASLAVSPRMGSPVSSVFRRMLLRQFPYAIYYRIDRLSGSIWIESVVHQSRYPGAWQDRIQEQPAVYTLAA
jgi:plasmid stabilization system protein ParE